MTPLYLDFEYFGRTLISCAVRPAGGKVLTYWLLDPQQRSELIALLTAVRTTHVLVGYEIQLAEARCVAMLGFDPNTFRWRDLLAEYRWLRNCTNEYMYGRVIKNNCARFTVPKRAKPGKHASTEEINEAAEINARQLEEMKEELNQDVGFDEVGFTLLEVCYFFEIITLEQYRSAAATKAKIRDGLIMSGDWNAIKARQKEILDYNAGDLQDMEALDAVITERMFKIADEPHVGLKLGHLRYIETMNIPEIQLSLGDWCARVAKYANRGIPLNKERLQIFLKVVPDILKQTKENWVRDHPESPIYRLGLSAKILEKRKTMAVRSPYFRGDWTRDSDMVQAMIDRYCKSAEITNWPRTRGGQYSTDSKLMEPFALEDTIIKHFQRHCKNLSSLNAFSPDKNGVIEALQHIDENCIQHPDYAPHGTQTDRNGHKTKSFVFANSHWMRILAEPAPGGAFIEFDLATGEIGINASMHDDELLKQAYMSNDFYTKYAQQVGAYPADLPIPTEEERDEAEWFKPYKTMRVLYKTMCLALQFGAGYKCIAAALAVQEHTPVDFDRAKSLVDEYHSTYYEARSGTMQLKEIIQEGAGILLQNGWRFGKDYKTILSALNVPIQGTGSCILQEICKRVDNEGFNVIATLHDSITVYCDETQVSAVSKRVTEIILDACEAVLGERILKVGKPEVVRHGDWWIHGKGAKDWERYKSRFIPNKPVVNATVTL